MLLLDFSWGIKKKSHKISNDTAPAQRVAQIAVKVQKRVKKRMTCE